MREVMINHEPLAKQKQLAGATATPLLACDGTPERTVFPRNGLIPVPIVEKNSESRRASTKRTLVVSPSWSICTMGQRLHPSIHRYRLFNSLERRPLAIHSNTIIKTVSSAVTFFVIQRRFFLTTTEQTNKITKQQTVVFHG